MRSLLCGVVMAMVWVTSPILSAAPPPQEKPTREIFAPFEDLEVLLDGDAHRVFLDRADYEELIAKAKTSPEKDTPNAWLTLAADYQITIDESRATIQAVIDIEVFSPGLFAVPLPLHGVGIGGAKLGDAVAPLGHTGPGQQRTGGVGGMGRHISEGGRGRRSSVARPDRKSTRLNPSHSEISYAVFCLKKKTNVTDTNTQDKDHMLSRVNKRFVNTQPR